MILRNICKMGPDIKSIQTLASNSVSPSDTWLIDFNKEMGLRPNGYGDLTVTYTSAFIKIFFDHTELSRTLRARELSLALYYEANFYWSVTNPLIFSGACPYYVTCYGVTKTCTFKDIEKLAQDKLEPTLTEKELRKNLLRNAAYMMRGKRQRPALTTVDPEDTLSEPEAVDLHYCCILNQNMKDATVFSEWLKQRRDDRRNTMSAIWTTLFQIAIACYALHLSQAAHNDLHSGNIYIKTVDPVKPVMYKVDDRVYGFEPKYVPYLFDFDRGYIKSIGENAINNGEHCVGYGQCNEAINNKDFIKSCCYFARYIPELVPQLAEIIEKKPGSFKLIQKDVKCFLRTHEGKGLAFTGEWFLESFRSMSEIIPRMNFMIETRFGSSKIIGQKIDVSDIHCLQSTFFTSDGVLKPKLVVEQIVKLKERYG